MKNNPDMMILNAATTTSNTTSSTMNANSNNTTTTNISATTTRWDEYERGNHSGGGSILPTSSSAGVTSRHVYHHHHNNNNSHRNTTTTTTTPHRPLLFPNRRMRHHKSHAVPLQQNTPRTSFSKQLRNCLLTGIPAYLVLIYIILKYLQQQQQQTIITSYSWTAEEQLWMSSNRATNHNNNHNMIDPHHSQILQELHRTLVQKDVPHRRHVQDPYIASNEAQAVQIHQQHGYMRRQNTRPSSNHPYSILPLLQIHSVLERERPLTRTTARYEQEENKQNHESNGTQTAILDHICGVFAQIAARSRPHNFAASDALAYHKNNNTTNTNNNKHAPKKKHKVRVLITGIVSSPIGYALALALSQQCGVQVLIGVDLMYPNSIRNRWRLQEQMAVLTKHLPKLVRPIFVAYTGLDPIRHSRNTKIFEPTQEIDWVQTVTPTHIVHLGTDDPAVFRYSDPEYKNRQSPYVTENNDDDDLSLLSLRSGMLSMEQLLASLAAAGQQQRPHFLYVSASTHTDDRRRTMHTYARRIDEVLADFYYQNHGVYSVGLRLPHVHGAWAHPESDLYRIVSNVIHPSNTTTDNDDDDDDLPPSFTENDTFDLLHVQDAVQAVIAAMQYRPEDGKPALFEISSDGENVLSPRHVQDLTRQILDTRKSSIRVSSARKDKNRIILDRRGDDEERKTNTEAVKELIGWTPRLPLEEGLVRTIAWHLDRAHPYGLPYRTYELSQISSPTATETGDMLLKRLSYPTCKPDDLVCHGGRPFLPCASECALHDQCLPTVFDEIVPMVQELTEECDIVLYTQNFDKTAPDLFLQTEFLEDIKPLVCNFAFIASESKLVETVIAKVPDKELKKLGFDPSPEDARHPKASKERKYEKLNGRLLYRGWILIWTKDTPADISIHEKFLLKLSPGRLFHKDVKSAVFIDQAFGVSPTSDDIQFLVQETYRKSWKPRVVKRKQRPKAKFLLPAEPQRRAIVLMSELKYQDSSKSERLSPDEKISTYEATRFMRFSNGEDPLGKEPPNVRLQREFYDRLRATINPDYGRGPGEPLHKFELNAWVRSRWVVHDMTHEESRQFRCEWYQEHVLWENDLDQLSFAYVMAKLELDRKLAHKEPDEVIQKHLTEKTEMKKLLSDTFEWRALQTEQNRLFSPYEEMQILPYDMEYAEERALQLAKSADEPEGPDTPLFIRIISDRIMAYARKSWSKTKRHR
jgi:nucleoside-diphosphate-sugar epimerase